MRDTELYRAILGLESPWTVARVELDVKQQRVDVYAEHGKRKTWPCPVCEAACGLHDHDEERTWRHLDSCQFQTVLHASVPRIRCDEHGVRQVRVPWAEPRSRFTLLFERFAIDVLHETDVLGAARILTITWDEAHGIMARAVARGLSRRKHTVPEYVGIDEKSIARGQTYATIACDLTDGHVIDVAPERTGESVVRCFGHFSLNDMAGIKAVAMDMWQPFIGAMTLLLPDASSKIVFDRFHIVSHMNHAVDMVRRRENRSLRAVGDERLVGSKYLWLYGTENVPRDRWQDFSALRSANLKTSRAWASKETLRALWDMPTLTMGEALSLALLGNALATATGQARRRHGPTASAGGSVLLHPSDHQFLQRGAQLDDPDDQEARFWLPQLRQLPCRHPVPLRRPSAIPVIRATRFPEEPRNRCLRKQGERIVSLGIRAMRAVAAVGPLFASSAGTSYASDEATTSSVQVTVERSRSERAQSCPDDAAIRALVSERMRGVALPPGVPPLIIRVSLDSDDESYTAKLGFSGRRVGARFLRAAGNNCSALKEDLFVLLNVLFDDESQMSRQEESQGRRVVAPRSPERQRPRIWIGGGSAATLGLPSGASGAAFGRASVGFDRWHVNLSGFVSPTQHLPLGPGEVILSAAGAQLFGCFDFIRGRQIALGGCVGAAGLALKAQSSGFTGNYATTTPWMLAGAGPDFSWYVQPNLSLGISANALATLHDESFSVASVGRGYVTPFIIGWAEAEARVQIW